jgi:hypothetical protein
MNKKNVKPEFEQAIQNQETVTKAKTERRECAWLQCCTIGSERPPQTVT